MAIWEVDIGLAKFNLHDSALEPKIAMEALRRGFRDKSPGLEPEIKALQYHSASKKDAEEFRDWVEAQLQDEQESYAGLNLIGGVLYRIWCIYSDVGWKIRRWLNNQGIRTREVKTPETPETPSLFE